MSSWSRRSRKPHGPARPVSTQRAHHSRSNTGRSPTLTDARCRAHMRSTRSASAGPLGAPASASERLCGGPALLAQEEQAPRPAFGEDHELRAVWRGIPALSSTRARRPVAIATSPYRGPSPGITGRGLRDTSLSRRPAAAPAAEMLRGTGSGYGPVPAGRWALTPRARRNSAATSRVAASAPSGNT